MVSRRNIDPTSRAMLRSLDRVFVWVGPALVLVGVVFGVLNLVGGHGRRALYDFLLAVVMVVSSFAARGRVRRDRGSLDSR